MGLDIPVFQAYRGTEPPRFASLAELECAKVLDYYGIPWLYEPTTFVLEEDEGGRVTEAFAPDFYLPDQDLISDLFNDCWVSLPCVQCAQDAPVERGACTNLAR